MALLISASSFYFTHCRIVHSLKLAVVESKLDDNELPCIFLNKAVIVNEGNRTETVVNAEVTVEGDAKGGHLDAILKQPIVLKADDAAPVWFNWELDQSLLEHAANWSGPEGEQKATATVVLTVKVVGSSGAVVPTRIELGRLTYEDINGTVQFVGSQRLKSRLVELVRNELPRSDKTTSDELTPKRQRGGA